MTKKNDIPKTCLDTDYYNWIVELSRRYRQSQIKAAVRVNSEMLKFYWSVGQDIEDRQLENRYGSHFYETLSRDLTRTLNNRKGLAPTSLWYAKSFYCLYSPLFTNLRQDAEKLGKGTFRQNTEKSDIEVKTTEFDFKDIGQLAGYTAMVDDLLNTAQDNPSIGLLICKEKNSILARYALSRVNVPIGISKYELTQQQLPKELREKLPTVEEIERGLHGLKAESY